MRTDTILFAAQFLVLILFAVYGALTEQSVEKLVYTLPLAASLLSFLAFLYLFARHERHLLEALDRRLPPLEYLETREEVHNALTDLAQQAESFIVATGGRATHAPYLEAIEEKLGSGRVSYWRILFDEPVSSDIATHLAHIVSLPNASLARVTNHRYNDVLVTDKGVIFVLPMPGRGGLMGVRVLSVATALKVYNYTMLLHKQAQSITQWPDAQGVADSEQAARPYASEPTTQR
jgi:hypothetical protein